MRGTFRAKLMAIVGSAALAFVVLFVSNAIIASRVDIELGRIEQRYLPRLEAAPKLGAQFDQIARGFQDAVAAHDVDALEKTHHTRDAFLRELAAVEPALDPGETAEVRAAIQIYYASALDVSRRLMAGETGEAIVEAMTAMQAKRAHARDALERATKFERAEIADAFRATRAAQATARQVQLLVILASLAFVLSLSLWLSRGALRSLSELAAGFARFGAGKFDEPVTVTAQDELADVAEQANGMAENLRKLADERERAAWIEGGLVGLAKELSGELSPHQAAYRAARFIAKYLGAPTAALFVREEGDTFRLEGGYGLEGEPTKTVRIGEGIVGEAATSDAIAVIADPPAGYVKVSSGIGEGAPRALVLVPLVHGTNVVAVLELATWKAWDDRSEELVLAVRETIAIAIDVARARAETRALLARAEELAERLKAGEEKLLATNEELRVQQEELQETNDELTRQARQLERQREALATVSAYKSQFLANMSHELRTPLNSMLLLSGLLADNAGGNLTPKQIEYAQTIRAAGNDLLALINQVLDLAKVEAGKQEIRIADVGLAKLTEHVARVFAPLAERKGLRFTVERSSTLPPSIPTDEQRVTQILVNLLGNAVKFTDQGSVELRIGASGDDHIAFAVRDTGIGIAKQHRERVFAPFEQVDGASDRKHGGTGLGLSIARELAGLLGGTLDFESTPGEGSTFTLVLPRVAPHAAQGRRARSPAPPSQTLGADVTRLQPDEDYLLVIEDDRALAEALGEIIGEQGLRWIGATDGETGLAIAGQRLPYGIVLDVKLPGVDGWTVMETLRADPRLSRVPVHFLSALDEPGRGAALGAVGWSTKPPSRRDLVGIVESLSRAKGVPSAAVLAVVNDDENGEALVGRIAREGLAVRRATTVGAARSAIETSAFGCIVVDLGVPGIDATAFVREITSRKHGTVPAIVVHASRPLDKNEIRELEACSVVVMREGASEERLLDEVRAFVRRIGEGLAPSRFGSAPRMSPAVEKNLAGRRVLVADDDMRTAYALSATLRAKGMEVLLADSGVAAIEALEREPNVGAVLMDIMMPEMDGYEATRRIRKDARFTSLPIIALTAKAMKGDRERCLEAGASDYLPKPVDIGKLLALLGSLMKTASEPRGVT